jgi:hypothetical protein
VNEQHLTIRLASPEDADALLRLAVLDSAVPLRGHVLVAESDGVPIAAVSLANGAVTADPFEPTEHAVRVLRLRRYQLVRQGGDVAPAQSLLRRLAPRPAR